MASTLSSSTSSSLSSLSKQDTNHGSLVSSVHLSSLKPPSSIGQKLLHSIVKITTLKEAYRSKNAPSRSVVCAATGKYSRGDAPGEYGGPPVDIRIRKTWGGNDPDPVTDPEKYIWHSDWKKRLDSEAAEPSEASKATKEDDSGFLSLGRSFALDSLDVDLSAQLSQPSKATLERQVAAARRAENLEKEKNEGDVIKWQFAPTRGEERLWEKATKYNSGGSKMLLRENPAKDREASIIRFQNLKNDLLLYTVGIGALCDVTAYVTYSPEVTASYAAGLVGAILYIRMLSSSVEALGENSVGGAAKGAIGQPRILVPVILVMVFNRWNNIVAPNYGVMELQLIPMLVGFFTYKAATLIQTFKEVMDQYTVEAK